MISRLINIDVPIISETIEPTQSQIKLRNFTVKDYAYSFINGMSAVQKSRFKKMLENHIECGMSIAKSYGVDYDEFIDEVKLQMGVEV